MNTQTAEQLAEKLEAFGGKQTGEVAAMLRKYAAEQDYTRAVIAERDCYKQEVETIRRELLNTIAERDQCTDNTIWQAKLIAELKEANSSLAGASIVPDDMVLISRKELAAANK